MNEPTDPASNALAALVDELKKPGSLALLFMATALSVTSSFNLPDAKLPAIWLVTICILWIAYIWISMATIRQQILVAKSLQYHISELEARPNFHLPKVIKAMMGPNGDNEIILLLKQNQLFGQAMLVSIYFEDERGLEILVADGSVRNIQMNGLIQIGISKWDDAHSSVQRRIIEQDQAAIDRLMVKPASNTDSNHIDVNNKILTYLINRVNGEHSL